MRKFLITFILFVYVNHVYEDLSFYKKWAYPIVYMLWFIRSLFTWLISPIFIIEYWFMQSKIYQQIKKLKNAKL